MTVFGGGGVNAGDRGGGANGHLFAMSERQDNANNGVLVGHSESSLFVHSLQSPPGHSGATCL